MNRLWGTGMTTSSHRFAGLAVYGERRTAVMLALGFSSGLPFLLIFDTLSAWLRQSNLSLQTIAFFGLAAFSLFLILWEMGKFLILRSGTK